MTTQDSIRETQYLWKKPRRQAQKRTDRPEENQGDVAAQKAMEVSVPSLAMQSEERSLPDRVPPIPQ